MGFARLTTCDRALCVNPSDVSAIMENDPCDDGQTCTVYVAGVQWNFIDGTASQIADALDAAKAEGSWYASKPHDPNDKTPAGRM